MNILHRHDHLGSYRRVENGYQLPNWSKIESSIFDKTGYSWRHFRKNTRVGNKNNEPVVIKIGGVKGKKKRQFLKNKSHNRIVSTKYTLLTFLPLNLFEQFRRIANFYFLCITIIGLSIDSPVNPITSLLPLAFVISVTAGKQGYEDYLRYKTDNIVNNSPVTVIRNGEEYNIKCQDVVEGDLVLVERDCDVPCDLVIMQSSDPSGKCFITTANLDGETNLKTLVVPKGVPKVETNKIHTLGTIECEKSRSDLYSFNGKIILSNAASNDSQYYTNINNEMVSPVLPLSTQNLLLRGSRLKNTDFVIGCAVYTGMDTKLALNMTMTRNKVSSAEEYINKFIIFILVTLLVLVTLMFFTKRYMEMFRVEKHGYLGPKIDIESPSSIVQDFLGFFILFNYLIPISLYVTIELHRIIGAFFMEWDNDLYCKDMDQQCIVNSSSLNEELGQINILFSDKTGTLTKNEMSFQQCSINGKKYYFNNTKLRDMETSSEIDLSDFKEKHMNFFTAIALCHSIQIGGKLTEEPELENGIKRLDQTGAMSDIAEESQSSLNDDTESATKEIISVLKKDDNNPLLNKIENARVKAVKISPKLHSSRRVHPATIAASAPVLDHDTVSFPTSMDLRKSKARAINRSISQIDLSSSSYNSKILRPKSHRRTQSYGSNPNAPRTIDTDVVDFVDQNITSSRESYALPIFTSRLSLSRTDSKKIKRKIQYVIENLDYMASSPDEKALLEACAFLGVVFVGDENNKLKLKICPPYLDFKIPKVLNTCQVVEYERLYTLDFTSDRKRMSVVVKDNNGTIWVLTKGAENIIFPLCSRECRNLIEKTGLHIDQFAKSGLRTLAIARKKISLEEFQKFEAEMDLSNRDLERRDILRNAAYANLEKDLDLLGATGVEDALQDNLYETLVSLKSAGIKVWVLTGDKIETALNIALASGHISGSSFKYFIIGCKSKEELEMHLKLFDQEYDQNNIKEASLLIDGESLKYVLSDFSEHFRKIALKCDSVLCCRLTPLQKSEIVRLIKSSKEKKYITAAIGDGANDVSMIQEAHVGVGIFGKEGRQAARCSDFAIAKFQMVKRIFLLHGHYHTSRLSLLVLYFFYKNTAFMGIQAFFQFDSMFSATSVYDPFFLMCFNVVYTALPILFISLTEQPYSINTLLKEPALYQKNTGNKALQWNVFLTWIFFAIYHSIIIYYMTYATFFISDVLMSNSVPSDLSGFSIIITQSLVLVTNFKLWIESKYHSYFYIATIWLSILVFVATTVVYNVIPIIFDTHIYFSYIYLMSSIPFYLLSIFIIVVSLLPDYVFLTAKNALNIPKRKFFPGDEKARRIKLQRNGLNHLQVQSTYL
ncbi:phospholipid-transporting ATPase IF isoform X2 [Condylostylus longicornis]|uniref:phospholipid-transporting ATPase IF isoform X2 n=1 Tax=Condylostylus longicornis TaxID=2530218 RepID=UPI00244DB897|nr:phospholipid-transporting ATPase IF isoform X2 [Condylostylus longicornis]